MTNELIASLRRLGVDHVLIDKRLSRSIREVGRFRLAKITRIAAFLVRLIRAAGPSRRFGFCVFFLACSGVAFLVDALAILILRLCRHRVVPYLHGIGFRELARRGWIRRTIVRYVLGAGAPVIVLGGAGEEDVRRWVPREAIRIIPNTVPDGVSAAAGGIGRPRNAAPIRCLYLSTLESSKGALEFLEAAQVVARTLPGVEFVLAGQVIDDEYRRRLERLASTGTLGRCVRMCGPVYGEDKDRLLANVDLLVVPTRYRFENQPLVILEAMKHGLPVISSAIGNIPEQIVDGVTGYLVDPSDREALARSMIHLCINEETRKTMGAAARERYESSFSPRIYDDRWRELIEEIVPRVPSRPLRNQTA